VLAGHLADEVGVTDKRLADEIRQDLLGEAPRKPPSQSKMEVQKEIRDRKQKPTSRLPGK